VALHRKGRKAGTKRSAVHKKSQRRVAIHDCKHFTGYKPCFPGTVCVDTCVDPDPIGQRILIINLDAMGNVLVTTTILPGLKRLYPRSRIYWITLPNAIRLLENNPFLDRVFAWGPESWLALQQQEFDLVLNVDKSVRSCAFLNSLRAREKRGFGLDRNGVVVPVNKEADYNYLLGLDDNLKFRVNDKTVSELIAGELALPYRREEYILLLSGEEEKFCEEYKSTVGLPPGSLGGRDLIVGFNTGCSELYPNKKMTIDQHVTLIERLSSMPGVRLVLLGGPEDTERNAEIKRRVGAKVVSTPTEEGVRRGLCYINLCDLVISGDSFGMHAAIGLKKHIIVWFGVSCPQEIELYGKGVKLVPTGLHCSPCWKTECPYDLECIAMIDLDRIIREVEEYRDRTGKKSLTV
jgi:ADP-heptose:LPS heptosyltransferase